MNDDDGAIVPAPITSYAQNFEDVILWRALGHVERGRYLDVGAHDPRIASVSLAFHERGWRGVHVEPNPLSADSLTAARPDEEVVRAAVGTGEGAIVFHVFGAGLSTGDPDIAARHREAGWAEDRIEVPTVTLGSLLDRFGGEELHWLKVDVEGMEADVLASWGDTDVRPWVVVVECTAPNVPHRTDAEWRDLLLDRDYEEVHFDGLNLFFLARERMELRDRFGAGPNVFDGFVLDRSSGFVAPLAHRAREVEAQNEALRTKNEALRAAHDAAQARIVRLENRSPLRRLLFHRSGKPRGIVRTVFFHASGKPRGIVRRRVIRPDGTPRRAFRRWMESEGYLALRWPAAYYAPSRLPELGSAHFPERTTIEAGTRIALHGACESYLRARLAQTNSN